MVAADIYFQAGRFVNRSVFLDRDGVLNHVTFRNGRSYPPERVEDFELIDGVTEACSLLKQAGFMLIVTTNQPDVATGKQKLETVEQMHAKLCSLLPLDGIRTCFHIDQDRCVCRKPQPGMLLAAAHDYRINLAESYMVGDRWRDIEAGQRAGCRCFFIDYHYQEKRPDGVFEVVKDFREAARSILT